MRVTLDLDLAAGLGQPQSTTARLVAAPPWLYELGSTRRWEASWSTRSIDHGYRNAVGAAADQPPRYWSPIRLPRRRCSKLTTETGHCVPCRESGATAIAHSSDVCVLTQQASFALLQGSSMWSLALLRGLGVNGTFGRQADGTFGRTDHIRATLPYNITAAQWTRWCVCQTPSTMPL